MAVAIQSPDDADECKSSQDDDDNNEHPPQHSVVLPSVWLRIPNTAWSICVGLAGHAIVWKKADETRILTFLDGVRGIDEAATLLNSFFWCTRIVLVGLLGAAYLFTLVREEWACPARIHFMNGPATSNIALVGDGCPQ
jgi:hypothetical protein